MHTDIFFLFFDSDYVRPICLPFIANATRLAESKSFYISGLKDNTFITVPESEAKKHVFVESRHINYLAERVTKGEGCGGAIVVDDPNQYLCIRSFEIMQSCKQSAP